MSQDAQAIIFYGYELGGPRGWKVTAPNPIPRLMNRDFEEYVGERELRARTTLEELGVDFVRYGHFMDVARWGLAASEHYVSQNDVLDLSFIAAPHPPAWDASLAEALEVLNITPTQQAPAWLAGSYFC
jgi:hypothetical protein